MSTERAGLSEQWIPRLCAWRSLVFQLLEFATDGEADEHHLPTSSTHAFQSAASKVVTSIRSSLAGMSSVTPEKNAELHAAAAKDKTCQSLAGTA